MVTKRFNDLNQSYDEDDEKTDYYNSCFFALKNGLDILEYLVAITEEWVENEYDDDPDMREAIDDLNTLMISNYDFMDECFNYFQTKVKPGDEHTFFREYVEKLVIKLFTTENKLVYLFDVFAGQHLLYPCYNEISKYLIR